MYLKKINPKFEEKALVTLTHGTQKVGEMLHFTLRNIAWYISKCCFEVLCEIVVLYITLRNVTLYSLKYSSMKKRMLQKTLGGQSSFSLSLICRADLVRHISQRTQLFLFGKSTTSRSLQTTAAEKRSSLCQKILRHVQIRL